MCAPPPSAEAPEPGHVETLAAAFAAAPLCACVVDARGRATKANARFLEEVGPLYTFAQRAFEHVGASDAAVGRLKLAFDEARLTGRSVKVRDVECLLLGSGYPVAKHVDWSVARIGDTGNLCVIGDVVAVADEAQREHDAELLDCFQNAPIAMHWLSGDGIVLWANNTELRVLGYTAEEYIGQPIMHFCPDDAELVLEIFKTLGSGASIKDVPVQFRAKDGRIVPLLIDSNVNYTKSGDFNHTRCFIRDDTGRKVNEARAELMMHELKRSAELFDAFVSRTLHLVRTPCHVVLAELDHVQTGELPRCEADSVLREATHLLEHVIGMTADVSDIMRFEQGAALKVRRQATDLREFCRAAVDLALPLVREGVELIFNFDAGGGSVSTDDVVVVRVLTHLLRNAAAATAQGRIVLRVSHGEDDVMLAVEDTGPGLNTGDLLFIKRYSADLRALEEMPLNDAVAARGKLEQDLLISSGKEGLGVGLSLSYWLVHALGGELQCESVRGRGTCFWFRLRRGAEDRGGAAPGEVYHPQRSDATRSRSRSASVAASMAAHVHANDVHASDARSKDGERRIDGDDVLDDGSACTLPPLLSSASSSRSAASEGSAEAAVAPESAAPESAARDLASPAALSAALELRIMASVGPSPEPEAPEPEARQPEAPEPEAPETEARQPEARQPRLGPWVRSDFYVPPPAPAAPTAAAVTRRGVFEATKVPHVLVVEDSPLCAKVLAKMLSRAGCTSRVVGDGAQGVAALEAGASDYDLVLMDLRMPVMDGFEATRIAKQRLGVSLPIVGVTAESGFDTRELCEESGFDGVTPKPVKLATIVELLQKHLADIATPREKEPAEADNEAMATAP